LAPDQFVDIVARSLRDPAARKLAAEGVPIPVIASHHTKSTLDPDNVIATISALRKRFGDNVEFVTVSRIAQDWNERLSGG